MRKPLVGTEAKREKIVNDQIVDTALKLLAFNSGLQYMPFDSEEFAASYRVVKSKFYVRKSSITTRMARFLYGLSSMLRPRNVLVVGSSMVNALVWLAIPVIDNARIVGVDTDSDACCQARSNLAALGATSVEILVMDGCKAGKLFDNGIDLLFIDVYSKVLGKTIYAGILEELEPRLSEGAVVLAHDACYEKFLVDLAPYIAIVRDRERFRHTLTVGIDRFGLEISIK